MSAPGDRPRPKVTLKLATSLDGRIAAAGGASRWITGPEARAAVHMLRAAHDLVVTGVGTVLADDPELTARTDPPSLLQPVRAVLDTRARTPLDGRLRATLARGPVAVCVGPRARRAGALEAAGFTLVRAALGPDGSLDAASALDALIARFAPRSVLIEAGGRVAGAMVRAGLVDAVEWFRAPLVIGGDGIAALDALGVASPAAAPRWRRLDAGPCGADLWERYVIEGD